MDVRGIGQGGQTSVPLNSQGQDNNVQTVGTGIENYAGVVNINSNGIEHRAIRESDIKKAVDEVNKSLQKDNSHIEYEVYGRFRDVVIKIVNDETKKVINESPPKALIDMVIKFCEMAGLFLDQKA